MRINTELELHIPTDSYNKIIDYATICDIEINGFADCDYDSELNALVVGEVYLIKQKATGADVEIDEEDMAKFMEERIADGALQMPRLQWHSHVNMGAFFSSVDQELMDNIDTKNESFMVYLVVNKSKELKCNVKVWSPFPLQIDDVTVVIPQDTRNIDPELIAEVKEKVKEEKFFGWQGGKKGKKRKYNNREGWDYDSYEKRKSLPDKVYTNYFPKLTYLEEAHVLNCEKLQCDECTQIFPKMEETDFKLFNSVKEKQNGK